MIVTLILITTFRPHTAGLHYCSKTFSFTVSDYQYLKTSLSFMLVDFYIGDEGIDKPGYATKVMLTWLVSSGQFCEDNREL